MVKVTLIMIGLSILVMVFLFQRANISLYLVSFIGFSETDFHPYFFFIVNKTLRLLLNDFACVLMIIAIFRERKYVMLAFYVFLFEFLIILPLYFVIKLGIEGDSEISSPLLSQVHRMIVNPTLMLLLIASLFYQRFKAKNIQQS